MELSWLLDVMSKLHETIPTEEGVSHNVTYKGGKLYLNILLDNYWWEFQLENIVDDDSYTNPKDIVYDIVCALREVGCVI